MTLLLMGGGPSVTVTTTSLPVGTVGLAYSSSLTATGGSGTGYTWAVTTGSLPTGLSLSSGGTISGTPSGSPGTSSFTVTVTDSLGDTGTASLSILIDSATVSITTTSLPNGEVGLAYSQTLTETGGTPGFTWTIVSGTLPAGLTLSTGGVISGTPTAAATSTFTVQVSDSVGATDTEILSLVISPALVITTTSLPFGTLGVTYHQVLAATGGSGTGYTWSILSGSLPTGFTLAPDGTVFGVPTASGTFNVTVQVTDSLGGTATQALAAVVITVPATITNYCPNPSFEVDLTGWSALAGATVAQDNTYSLFGQNSLQAISVGAVPGEGFVGPESTAAPTNTTGALGVSLISVAAVSLNVSAVDQNGNILASTLVSLPAATWQRVTLQNFNVLAGITFALVVQTNTPEALFMWADAVQYELGVTAASNYIDGNQNGCVWLGTPGLSVSEQIYLNATSATGSMQISGRATPVAYDKPFYTSASGKMTLVGDAAPTIALPAAAFADFAIFELTDPDPAMTYVDQNNAGTNAGTSSYVTSYGLFYPPLDYLVSGNKYLWTRAAFASVGFYYTGLPAANEELLTDIQVALSPLTGGTPSPAAYTPPRQVATIIKPTRLNYCPNPSFEVSTSGWSGFGTAALALDSTRVPSPSYATVQQVGNLGTYFNNSAISLDGNTGLANLDGSKNSYSQSQLALAGLGIGASILSGGIEYTMPQAGAGTPDNVMATGQTMLVAAPPGAQFIGFLGTSVNGGSPGSSGTVTFNYTDGTNSSGTLGFSDWTLNSGGGAVQFGNTVAGTMPYHNASTGAQSVVNTYVFSAMLPLNSAKQLASITLPANNKLHIFAVSLAEALSPSFGSNSCKITVNANGDGMTISIPDLIVGDIYTVSLYTQVAAGIGAVIMQCGSATETLSNSVAVGGSPYGGPPGYGEGLYGGATTVGSDLTAGVWFRPSLTFTATASTMTLSVSAAAGPDYVSPSQVWVDAVLIEAGELVGSYFDGSFGSTGYLDYQWEAGGTAGLTRSYYYEQFTVKKFSVAQILGQHIPLGLTSASPTYLLPYTQ